MTHRRRRSIAPAFVSRDARYAWGIAIAAPQVMALRFARMMLAGPQAGRRDRDELHRMWTEKVHAFAQGWMIIGVEAWLYPTRLAAAMMGRAPSALTPIPLPNFLGRGLAPVHRTVRANHRRLTRRRAA